MAKNKLKYIGLGMLCGLIASNAIAQTNSVQQLYDLPPAAPQPVNPYGGYAAQPNTQPQPNPYGQRYTAPAPAPRGYIDNDSYYQPPQAPAARGYIDNDNYYQAPKSYNCNTIADNPSCGGG